MYFDYNCRYYNFADLIFTGSYICYRDMPYVEFILYRGGFPVVQIFPVFALREIF